MASMFNYDRDIIYWMLKVSWGVSWNTFKKNKKRYMKRRKRR